MRSVSVIGDPVTTNHACDSITTTDSLAPPSVFVGGVPIILEGDPPAAHTILAGIVCVPHVGQAVTAKQSTVFAEGKYVIGATDQYAPACGTIDESGANVFIP